MTADKTVLKSTDTASLTVSGTVTALAEGTVNIKASVTLGGVPKESSVQIIIDNTLPVTAFATAGTPVNGWYNSDVTVTLSATDEGGSTVQRTEYSLDNGLTWIEYTIPAVISAEGHNTLSYRSVDKAGNVEDAKQETVKIDKTAPVTTVISTGTKRSDGTYNSRVNVTLTAEDAAGGSGIAGIEYSLDGINWRAYTAPLELTEDGVYSISFKASDNVGNTEAVKSISINISMNPDVMVHISRKKLMQ